MVNDDFEILSFKSPAKWEAWLAKNHAKSEGVWLRLSKKDATEKTLSNAEALDGALCFGWIDSRKEKFDAESWLQRFTPRRPKSIWSKRNVENCERLIKEKKMRAAGLRQIEKAKADGRWSAAYDAASESKIPDDLLEILSKNKKAMAFFRTLSKANLYAITWRLQTAKKVETREKRIIMIVSMLENGETFHA